MVEIRVLVGTRKGAFVITSDGARRDWRIEGPHFGGWEVMHFQGSPADPDRLYASQWTDWHGQVVQRSDDGGQSWEPVGNEFAYEGVPGTHQWYDGTPHPWEFKRVWHLEPSPNDPDTVYAGVEDAALFRSSDGGHTWVELAGLRTCGWKLRTPLRSRQCSTLWSPATRCYEARSATAEPKRAERTYDSSPAGRTCRMTNPTCSSPSA